MEGGGMEETWLQEIRTPIKLTKVLDANARHILMWFHSEGNIFCIKN